MRHPWHSYLVASLQLIFKNECIVISLNWFAAELATHQVMTEQSVTQLKYFLSGTFWAHILWREEKKKISVHNYTGRLVYFNYCYVWGAFVSVFSVSFCCFNTKNIHFVLLLLSIHKLAWIILRNVWVINIWKLILFF